MTAADLQKNLVTRVNVGDMLTRTAWRRCGHEAVVDGERRLTYRALNRRRGVAAATRGSPGACGRRNALGLNGKGQVGWSFARARNGGTCGLRSRRLRGRMAMSTT